jgi:hypothetical protein
MGHRQDKTLPEVNASSAIYADRISQQRVVRTGRPPVTGKGENQPKDESGPNPHILI